MKNLQLLPTDKPSILVLETTNNNLFITTTENFGTNIMKFQNIYVTSDEVIKEGDYRFSVPQNNIELVTEFSFKVNNQYWVLNPHFYKKVILTTDQELIADGVQAIDEDFLNWFVKNPSCEEVEIEKGYRGYNLVNYKIFIPKEEINKL